MVAGLLAWPFMSDYSCSGTGVCDNSNNQGWRYLLYTSGALVFLMSIARVTVIRLKETPKYCLGQNEDDKVAETIQWMANKYNRPCSLTAEQLRACGQVQTSMGRKGKWSISEFTIHWKGLFLTRKLAISTSLIWFSWTLIGLAYPLYNVFLPTYLKTRGAQTGDASNYTTWRNYAIVNMCGVWGPVLAGNLPKSVGFNRPLSNVTTRIHVQPEIPWSQRHHGHWRAGDHGLFLRLYAGAHRHAKPRLQLRHLLLPEHLLRHTVRLHARGVAFGTPRDGQWN